MASIMALMSNYAPCEPIAGPREWAPTATLPPEITSRLLADIDVIARRMTRRIAAELALPAQFRSIGYLRSVTVACRDALRTLVRLLRDGRGLRTADLQRLARWVRQQAEMGVPLEVLLAAYRLAARVVWRELIGESAGLDALPPPPSSRSPDRCSSTSTRSAAQSVRLPGDPRAADAPSRPRPRPHPPEARRRRRRPRAPPSRRRQRARPSAPLPRPRLLDRDRGGRGAISRPRCGRPACSSSATNRERGSRWSQVATVLPGSSTTLSVPSPIQPQCAGGSARSPQRWRTSPRGRAGRARRCRWGPAWSPPPGPG